MSEQVVNSNQDKVQKIINMTGEELFDLLKSHGLRVSEGQVDIITKFVDKVNEGDYRIIENSVCVRMYDKNGKYYLYNNDAKAYQKYLFKRIQNLIDHKLFIIKIDKNPETHRLIKYLCLNI